MSFFLHLASQSGLPKLSLCWLWAGHGGICCLPLPPVAGTTSSHSRSLLLLPPLHPVPRDGDRGEREDTRVPRRLTLGMHICTCWNPCILYRTLSNLGPNLCCSKRLWIEYHYSRIGKHIRLYLHRMEVSAYQQAVFDVCFIYRVPHIVQTSTQQQRCT